MSCDRVTYGWGQVSVAGETDLRSGADSKLLSCRLHYKPCDTFDSVYFALLYFYYIYLL